MRWVSRIAIAVVAMVLCSCQSSKEPPLMVGVDIDKWNYTTYIPYDNDDTLSVRNLNIALRYNDNFKSSTLPLKIAITTPDTLFYEEAIELQLQHPHTALAVATTESRPYRTEVRLNRKGRYIFTLHPLVEVRGVEAIGIEFN